MLFWRASLRLRMLQTNASVIHSKCFSTPQRAPTAQSDFGWRRKDYFDSEGLPRESLAIGQSAVVARRNKNAEVVKHRQFARFRIHLNDHFCGVFSDFCGVFDQRCELKDARVVRIDDLIGLSDHLIGEVGTLIHVFTEHFGVFGDFCDVFTLRFDVFGSRCGVFGFLISCLGFSAVPRARVAMSPIRAAMSSAHALAS